MSEHKLFCTRCEGSGSVNQPQVIHTNAGTKVVGNKTKSCPDCNGKGYSWGKANRGNKIFEKRGFWNGIAYYSIYQGD